MWGVWLCVTGYGMRTSIVGDFEKAQREDEVLFAREIKGFYKGIDELSLGCEEGWYCRGAL